MKKLLLVPALMSSVTACSTGSHLPQNPYESASERKRAAFKKVELPFPPGTAFTISQGAFGKASHAEVGNEYAWDFDVPFGTVVTAVQAGKVIEVWAPHQGGGCDSRFRDSAHNIKIEHEDGTVAQYVHVDARVNVGESVRTGQALAVTANNGWLCTPQLHFGIYHSRSELYSSGQRKSVPLRFRGLPDGLAKTGLKSEVPKVREIALTFDDAPVGSTSHFESFKRTQELIRKLKVLNVPSVMVFANACRRGDSASVIRQLKAYKDQRHFIGNHTCSHPRLDDVGFDVYAQDIAEGERLLNPLFKGQKYFRFPFLNESKDTVLRDRVRSWLKENHYRNGMVSADNDDYIFSFKINQARKLGKKIDYEKVKKLFVTHVLEAAEFYDDLAERTIGRSPKHVLLLHEMDATVLYMDALVSELRARGWKIIGADEAFADPLYLAQPKNTYANDGIVAQVALEKTGEKIGYGKFEEVKAELDRILGL